MKAIRLKFNQSGSGPSGYWQCAPTIDKVKVMRGKHGCSEKAHSKKDFAAHDRLAMRMNTHLAQYNRYIILKLQSTAPDEYPESDDDNVTLEQYRAKCEATQEMRAQNLA